MTFRKRLASRRFWIFTLALCALAPLVAWWRQPALLPPAKAYSFPTRELAELDREVQARFAVVPDKDFGLSRIGPRHGYFSPLTPREKSVIAALQKSKQEVVFYVVGRNTILKQHNVGSNLSPVQGPVYITPHAPVQVNADVVPYTQARYFSSNGVAKDAPSDKQLIDVARPIFADASIRLGTNTKINSWNVVARPVEASSQACVNCHNARITWKTPDKRTSWSLSRSANLDIVSLHDTLGIALYCYRPARKIETKKLSEAEIVANPKQ